MRTGRVTQTIWNRSVKKEIQKGNQETGSVFWEEACFELEEGSSRFVWSSATVSGESPAEIRFAVIKATGDLSAKGIAPRAVSVQVLFPEMAEEKELKEISKNLWEICLEMKLEISGVQAESTDGIMCTMISVTATGVAEKEASETENCEKREAPQKKWNAGTEIIFCGYSGLEGTLRILEEAEGQLRTRFTPSFLEKTRRCKENLVVPEQILEVAQTASCRQCGDGGVLCGLWELAEAEKIGFEIDFSKLPLRQETVEICEFFQLNPYLLTSAGSFLVLTEYGEETLAELKKAGIDAVRIGTVKEQNARVLVHGEETRYLDRPAVDELRRWWKEQKSRNEEIQE